MEMESFFIKTLVIQQRGSDQRKLPQCENYFGFNKKLEMYSAANAQKTVTVAVLFFNINSKKNLAITDEIYELTLCVFR
jgi:hypothetical protein